MEENNLTPSQYFENIKNAKNTVTLKSIRNSYGIMAQLAEKYNITGQIRSLQKLNFLVDVLSKEEKLVELGITTFVYKDVIEDYIEGISNDVVKIVELSRYTREIPDEFVEIISKTKDIFDEMYVVFTDYTGKEERKTKQERRDKDPILFGCFKNSNIVADRFYVLGDWIDEYCDLTLDKLIDQYQTFKKVSPKLEIQIPQTIEELKTLMSKYVIPSTINDDLTNFRLTNSVPKSSFLTKVKLWLKKV